MAGGGKTLRSSPFKCQKVEGPSTTPLARPRHDARRWGIPSAPIALRFDASTWGNHSTPLVCSDLGAKRWRIPSTTFVHLRFDTGPSSLICIRFDKWDPLAHSHFDMRPSIAGGWIGGSCWYTGVPYLFFYSSYFLTASHRVSGKEEKPSLLWYTSTRRGNLPLLVELVLSQCNKGGEISSSHASSFRRDERCNTHCHFHVTFGARSRCRSNHIYNILYNKHT